MQNTPLIIGIILVVLGIIGLLYGFYTGWMWVVIVIGIIGVVWGFMPSNKMGSAK